MRRQKLRYRELAIGWAFAKAPREELQSVADRLLACVMKAMEINNIDADVRETIRAELAEKYEAEIHRLRPRRARDQRSGARRQV